MTGVWKSFGRVTALAGAELTVHAGEIHVILGENGAGKTSLMSVLAGLYRPDRGEIVIDGRPVQLRSPRDALSYGVAMVHQHFELIGNMTVWENVVLGHEGTGWALRPARQREAVQRVAAEQGIDVNVDARVGELPVGLQQKVEILKMLYRRARILILDEPTTFLTPQETDSLFQTLRELAARSLAILLVTHKIRDAMNLGDRLTLMRAGRVVLSLPRRDASEEELVRHLMGEGAGGAPAPLEERPGPDPRALAGEVLLRLDGVSTPGARNRLALRDIHLTLKAGEIHGVAGVAGSGQQQLADVLLGLLPASAGRIELRGRDITRWPVARRLEDGIALIPEDRVRDGILPDMSLWETLVLGVHRQVFPGGRFRPGTGRALADAAISEYEVKAPHCDVPTAYLSGGNMQKVLVARTGIVRDRHPRPVVIAANPTRGLDIRTVERVHRHLAGVAAQGGSVLLISEDLDELAATCHRISVLYRGSLVATFEGPEYDRYRIGEAMLGKTAGDPAAVPAAREVGS